MRRHIVATPAIIETGVSTEGLEPDARAWLEQVARDHELRWLLAHSDDGVTWGELQADVEGAGIEILKASDTVAPSISPPLRAATLQMARLFALAGELLVWRDGVDRWRARLVRDARDGEIADFRESFDEEQLLWGNRGQALDDSGFVLMSDGAQGLRHAVPLREARGDWPLSCHPLRLRTRNYVLEDGDDGMAPGFTRVVLSRLVELRSDTSPGEDGQ